MTRLVPCVDDHVVNDGDDDGVVAGKMAMEIVMMVVVSCTSFLPHIVIRASRAGSATSLETAVVPALKLKQLKHVSQQQTDAPYKDPNPPPPQTPPTVDANTAA